MKFISSIFFFAAFTAIVALGVLVIVPMFQEYHEGMLSDKAIRVLDNEWPAGECEVVVDHHYAKKVVISKLSVSDAEKERIKSRAADLLSDIPGLYAEKSDIEVRSLVPIESSKKVNLAKKAIVQKPKLVAPESQESGNPAKPVKPPIAPVVLAPGSVDVFWDDDKTKIKLIGLMLDDESKSDVAEKLKAAFKGATVRNEIKVVASGLAKSFDYTKVETTVHEIMLKSYRAGSVHYQGEPASLVVSGLVESPAVYRVLSDKLSSLDHVAVENQLFIQPRFTVVKDAQTKTISITGYVQDTAVILGIGSAASQLNGYRRDNQIKWLKECAEMEWTDENQAQLAHHLTSLTEGKLIYHGNELTEIHGITHDKKYKAVIDVAFEDVEGAAGLKLKQRTLPEPVDEAITQLAQKLKGYKIFFKSGSDYVDGSYSKSLIEIAAIIKASKDKTSVIIIGGYADNSGKPASNKTLSLKRARSVLRKLVALGVPAQRTKIEFFGAEDIVDKKFSRRVEIRVANAGNSSNNQN